MDQKFIKIAEKELREDELRKQQALAQFRDCLSKHPFLKNVRQGELIVNKELVQIFPNFVSKKKLLLKQLEKEKLKVEITFRRYFSSALPSRQKILDG